jgi:hypothetical protein
MMVPKKKSGPGAASARKMPAFNLDAIDDGFLTFYWYNMPASARASICAARPQTAWIFGAGASHHFDLNPFGVPVPLATGFFKAFHALPTSQGFNAHVGPLMSFLEHYRGILAGQISGFDENIEDFMTSVELDIEKLRKRIGKRSLNKDDVSARFSLASVFSNMNFIFANVLNEAQNGPSFSLYRHLLDICGPNDSFITFNWDTLLDRALADSGGWSPNDGYGIKFKAVLDGGWTSAIEGAPQVPTKWKLLKLHGSTNWLIPYMAINFQTLKYAPLIKDASDVFLYWHSTLPYETHHFRWRGGYAPTCYCYYPPNLPADLFPKGQVSAGKGKIFFSVNPRIFSPFSEGADSGVPSSPLLITPVRQKKYDIYKSAIARLWDQATETLRTASRIVIVGYSFPKTDIRPLGLLRSVLRERADEIELEVIAPDVKSILERIGHPALARAKSVKAFDMKFEDYIAVLAGTIPNMMRQAAAKNEDVYKWLLLQFGLMQHALAKIPARRRQHYQGN